MPVRYSFSSGGHESSNILADLLSRCVRSLVVLLLTLLLALLLLLLLLLLSMPLRADPRHTTRPRLAPSRLRRPPRRLRLRLGLGLGRPARVPRGVLLLLLRTARRLLRLLRLKG